MLGEGPCNPDFLDLGLVRTSGNFSLIRLLRVGPPGPEA